MARAQKKGKKSWKPATQLVTFDKDPDYVYRFCDSDRSKTDRKVEEGWEFANRVTDKDVSMDATDQKDPVTGGLEYRELVLMRMPKRDHPDAKDWESRTAYFADMADTFEQAAKQDLESTLSQGGKAKVHGKIIIE